VAEYDFKTGFMLGFFVVVVIWLWVFFSGGQQTIGVDPLNEHSWGIMFFLSPSFATGHLSILRQMELAVFPSPFRQISSVHEYTWIYK